MKHACVTVVVVALMGCALLTEMYRPNDPKGWDSLALVGLVYAAWYFYKHADGSRFWQ